MRSLELCSASQMAYMNATSRLMLKKKTNWRVTRNAGYRNSIILELKVLFATFQNFKASCFCLFIVLNHMSETK
jgi:hypothetical protein